MNYHMTKLIVLLMFLTVNVFSQQIVIHKHDAVVWGTDQIINGKLVNFTNSEGIVHLNGEESVFTINDDEFSIPITIGEGLNTVLIEVMNQDSPVFSDTLKLTLGYNIQPEISASITIEGSTVNLIGEVLENPDNSDIVFEWAADENNPVYTLIQNAEDLVTSTILDFSNPLGEYYFNLYGYTSNGDTLKARTFCTLDSNQIRAFNIKTDYAAWIDSAIIYEITPYTFVIGGGSFKVVKNTIPDLIRLGINTIWIQPVFKTKSGQGYDIINYFEVRPDLGTRQDLRELVQTAKANGLRVMFDFVPNHSSIDHPYARETVEYGEDSHYWNFYQREKDNVFYSIHYHYNGDFIYYFWDELPNLNFNNPEVEKWISEAVMYWIKEFDIDGYRFDAVWGVNARKPDFIQNLRLQIKRYKPEFFMLGEDKATRSSAFDERFDAAFDWFPEENWVSHWVFQWDYTEQGDRTIFNFPNEASRSSMLRDALTNYGTGFADNAKILRCIGNNDIPHFITYHGVKRTKMAAALIFTLNGIPLIYNGQEVGKEGHPYYISWIFYGGGFGIDYDDPHNFFPYYQRLIEIRKNMHALSSDKYEEVAVSPSSSVFGFRRWDNSQNIFTVLNMASSSAQVTVNLPVDDVILDSGKTYYLTELITGEVISGVKEELRTVSLLMPEYNTKVFLLADSAYQVTGINSGFASKEMPMDFQLHQNYPNPFNPSTIISYSLPESGKVVIKMFDALGREVKELVNGYESAGVHKIKLNAGDFATGVYFYRVQYQDNVETKKMILLK